MLVFPAFLYFILAGFFGRRSADFRSHVRREVELERRLPHQVLRMRAKQMIALAGRMLLTSSEMWSPQNELCQLANVSDLKLALQVLRLTEDIDVDFEIKPKQDWIRSGAETYLYQFDLQFSTGKIEQLVFKACVAWTPGKELDTILQSWVDRRQLLAAYGISTPRLFAHGAGTLLEEYIPHSLMDRLNSRGADCKLLVDLAHLAGILVYLGFEPIEPFENLRSRGDDVVVIDFGEDLGPPRRTTVCDLGLVERLLKKLSKWGVAVSDEERRTLIAVFHTVSSDQESGPSF
jgi:hypothetical protein